MKDNEQIRGRFCPAQLALRKIRRRGRTKSKSVLVGPTKTRA